jgi:hypothetical protein
VSETLIAECSAEVIPRLTGADSKACFTFFPTCAAGGSRFPLIVFASNLVPSDTRMKCDIHPVDGVTKTELWNAYAGFAIGFRMEYSALSWTISAPVEPMRFCVELPN